MNKVKIAFLLCFMSAFSAHAQMFPITNNVFYVGFDFASYDTSVTNGPLMGPCMASFIALNYPDTTLNWMSYSRSGSGILGDRQETQAKRLIPFYSWALDAGASNVYDLAHTSENGGPNASNIVVWFTNLFAAPATWYNGTANTNEGVATPPVIHIAVNGINDNPYLNPGANQAIAAATLSLTNFGIQTIDLWNPIYNGQSTDSSQLFGFNSGGHPYSAGYLAMALYELLALGAETNIGSCTIDFNAALARSTNHMTVSSLARSGNTLTWTNHFDRIPGGWDVPDGTITNDARNCFVIYPSLANTFQWTIQVTNLPSGNYRFNCDGEQIATLSSTQLAAGWNMFTNYVGPLWRQRVNVLGDYRDWYGVNRVSLLEVGQTGPLGPNLIGYESNAGIYPGVTGTNFVSIMHSTYGWPRNMDLYMAQAHDDAQQTNHFFSIGLIVGSGYDPSPFR